MSRFSMKQGLDLGILALLTAAITQGSLILFANTPVLAYLWGTFVNTKSIRVDLSGCFGFGRVGDPIIWERLSSLQSSFKLSDAGLIQSQFSLLPGRSHCAATVIKAETVFEVCQLQQRVVYSFQQQ